MIVFYFMTFIPKLHILATRGKKVEFWPFFYTFRPFWRTSRLKRKRVNKTEMLHLVLEDVGIFLLATFLPTEIDRLRFPQILDCPSTFLPGCVFADQNWRIKISSNTGPSVNIFAGTCFCWPKLTDWDFLKYWTVHPHFCRGVFLPTKIDGLRFPQTLNTGLSIHIFADQNWRIEISSNTGLSVHIFADQNWWIEICSNIGLSVHIFAGTWFCRPKLTDWDFLKYWTVGPHFCWPKLMDWDFLKYWTVRPHFCQDVFLPTKIDRLRFPQILDC